MTLKQTKHPVTECYHFNRLGDETKWKCINCEAVGGIAQISGGKGGIQYLKKSEDKEMKWCEHMHNCKPSLFWTWKDIIHRDFAFCPECGTPRPQELSVKERLAKLLERTFLEEHLHGKNSFEAVAQAALDFIEANKK